MKLSKTTGTRLFTLLLSFPFMLAAQPAPAGTWIILKEKSSVGFWVDAKTTPVNGVFRSYDLKELVYTGHPQSLRGLLEIQTASVSTRNAKRDAHLREEDFFHSTKHPIATVRVQEIQTTADGHRARILLKIREKEQEYWIDRLELQSTPQSIRARGKFKVNRLDYGITGNIVENTIMDDEAILSFDLWLVKVGQGGR